MARKARPIYRVQVLERAVDMRQVLSEDSSGLAAREAAERLSPHKSTIHRLLTVLDHHRLIRRNVHTGRYTLGLHLFEVMARPLRGRVQHPRARKGCQRSNANEMRRPLPSRSSRSFRR